MNKEEIELLQKETCPVCNTKLKLIADYTIRTSMYMFGSMDYICPNCKQEYSKESANNKWTKKLSD